MLKIKKMFSALLVLASLSTATAVAPAREANAGIILAPAGVGVVLLVFGLVYHDLLLIVLDADGNLSQSSLEQNLSKTYSFIDDRDVISNLASTIRAKAAAAAVVNGKKTVTLSRTEVLDVLAPTGLADLQPEAVEGLIRDLQ